MRIENSTIGMEASREFKRVETTYTKVSLWNAQKPLGDSLALSPEGLEAMENDGENTQHLMEVVAIEEEDPFELTLSEEDKLKLMLLEKLITWVTGKPFKFNFLGRLKKNSQEASVTIRPPAPTIQTIGLEIQHEREVAESEKMNFAAAGHVKTEDGQSINFHLNLHMSRETYKRTSIKISSEQTLIDPLVIQTDSIPPGLSDKTLSFDLDLDGNKDEMALPKPGSGFLVWDRNKNGTIDDGSELFGPQTNNGFDELRALDSDGNNWIDENDEIFSELQIWSLGSDGNMHLQGLLDADVGAIYLGSASTEFKLTDDNFEQNGQLRESGIYLKESGGVSSIHELDILI